MDFLEDLLSLPNFSIFCFNKIYKHENLHLSCLESINLNGLFILVKTGCSSRLHGSVFYMLEQMRRKIIVCKE